MERNRPAGGPAVSDRGPDWDTTIGVARAAVVITTATTTSVTDAPTTGSKIVITDIIVSSDTAQVLTFIEETSATVIFKLYIGANVPVQITPRSKVKLATANKKLQLTTSGAVNCACTVLYYSEV